MDSKETLNKIKDFCVKNIRYIAAGVIVLALVFILVKCTGKTDRNGVDSTEPTETQFVLDTKFEDTDNAELNTLITDYMNAYAKADFDTIEALARPVSDNEKSYIGVFSQYIENYQNISVHYKDGADKGTYLVSVAYDLKFYEVETPAPGLEFFYVETDENGKLFINNRYSSYNLGRGEEDLDSKVYGLIQQYEQQEEVVSLQKQVEDAYNTAISNDASLAEMLTTKIPNAMSEWIASVNAINSTEQTTEEPTEQPSTEEPQPETQQETEAPQPVAEEPASQPEATHVRVKEGTGINVRREPSGDSESFAGVNEGEVYSKLGVEGEWTKIDYEGEAGYVKSDFVEDVTN